MEWKPAEGDMPRVTFRTNINVPNITLVILIITINVFVNVDVCAALCCSGLCLCSLAERMLKESICSCHLCHPVYRNFVFARDGIG